MTLWQDVRFAVRLLRKDPWFTAAAAIALALGIGANAAVFTLVNAVLIRDLPFDDPERVIALTTIDARGRRAGVALSDFQDWRDQSKTMSELAAVSGAQINVAEEGKPAEQFHGSYISSNFFAVLGAKALIGRAFASGDDDVGAAPVTVLSHTLWQSRYGGDPSVLGRVIRVNSLSATVIGVMGPSMQFPNGDDLWMALAKLPAETRDPRRNIRNFNVFGRLASGVTLAQSRAEFQAITKRLADAYPDTNKDTHAELMTYADRTRSGPLKTVFLSLMGAVAFVLLIACANVANLLLARSAHRSKEISVRVALGASRWRIVRQLLIESLLLAVLATIVGFALARAGIQWFDWAVQDAGKPPWIVFRMDATVFAFIAAICLGTAVLFGLAPALHISSSEASDALKEGGRGGTASVRTRRWTSVLIVTEVVLTLVLLAGAGFMMKSFLTLYDMNAGVETSHLLTMQLYLPLTKYPTPGPRTAVFDQFEERLRAIPSIQASTLTTNYPLGGGYLRLLDLNGHTIAPGERRPEVTMVAVSDSYFATLNVRVLRGRALNRGDGLTGHEAVVVNQRFVTTYFATQDPIGQRVRLLLDAPAADGPWQTVVGVAQNVRQRGAREATDDPVVYVPNRTDPQRSMFLIVRTVADPGSVTAGVREAMRAIEPDLPLFNIRTLDQLLARDRWQFTVFGSMFATFALIALVLSAVGLYAMTAYSVTQRTPEIGIRMALGARPHAMQWLVLRRALLHLAVGLPIGMAGAYGVGKLLQGIVVATGPGDPSTLGAIAVVLVIAAVGACVWPARRAARLDPMMALRYE